MLKPGIRKYKETADNPPKNKELLEIHNRWETECISVNGVKLRAGYFPSKIHPPKANILYLEGLADSMFNHERLINTLSEAGYRTITFDYPGQGGSEGSMNQTLITDKIPHLPGILIEDMADEVWKEIKKNNKIDSKKQIDAVIGWSTGGIAALDMARRKKKGVRAVVLIAPGTNLKIVTDIKAETLNGNRDFKHLDNIWPTSTKDVPKFTAHLSATSLFSHHWPVDSEVKGLVLLSDPTKDSYVDSKGVGRTLERNAGHFEFVNYPGAAHEIDNESDEHRTDKNGFKLEDRVVEFFDRILG